MTDYSTTEGLDAATIFTKYVDSDSKDSVDIPVPLPGICEPDEYMSKLYSNGLAEICRLDEVRSELKQHLHLETKRVEDERGDKLIEKILSLKQCNLRSSAHNLSRDQGAVRNDTFARKFSNLMHSSSGTHLKMLMDTECNMAKEMAQLTKTRAWEVEALSRECDSIIAKSTDMHPFQLQQVNDKLKQVHSSYACQISALVENQRKQYREFVDKLCTDPGELPEPIDTFSQPCEPQKEEKADVDESFTVYIGAQLKSMHNVRLVSSPDLYRLCKPNPHSKLQLALNLYGRSLSGLLLLVRKDPAWHIINRTEFATLCEQTTELHFATHVKQIETIKDASKQANAWRISAASKSSDRDGLENGNRLDLHPSDSLLVGDVYCTRHSNLQQQVIFHMVADDQLASCDISSRHPVLNGIRNIIRVASRISLTNLYIPLLLIDQPSESTTNAWCIRRAEMVYKCVKGYLMEVCGSFCGGSPNETLHYNIHFVVPAGLSPSIYQSLRSMLPSVFHLVPSVEVRH